MPTVARRLPPSAQRVQQALDASGLGAEVIELVVAARTAQQAADALGVDLGQIAKSLLFRGADSSRPVLVIAAGRGCMNRHGVLWLCAWWFEYHEAAVT